MDLFKISTAKPTCCLVIDTTLSSNNPLRFRKNLAEWVKKLIVTIDDKVREENLQYNINREAAKRSALSSRKNDKYDFLTGEEILPSASK